MSGVPPQQPQQPPPQNNTTTNPGQPTSPPKGQPTQNVIWANQSGPSSKQVWEEGWKNFKLGIQAFLASQKARNQAAQQRARAYETNRGNGNCPNCGSPNVVIGTHSDGGNCLLTLLGILLFCFSCCFGLIFLALGRSRRTGEYCRCLYCGQRWSA
jgi:hypothetical protein